MEHHELVARIAALETELAHLKAEATTRRQVFKSLAIAGAGAVTGAAVLGRAEVAGATSGNALVLGQAQTVTNLTALVNMDGNIGNGPGTSLTTEPTMFWVDNRGSTLANAVGIRADGRGVNGSGVWGHSDSGGIGVRADGGIGVLAAGTRAAVQLVPLGPPPPDRLDAHTRGELVSDANGDLWFCTADGTPGTWWQLTAAPPTTIGGLLTALAAPVRVYDSRPGGSDDGPLAGGGQRTISLASGKSSGATVDAVPAGAAAALVTLTLDATSGAGFLAVFANGLTYPGNSNVNWYTNGQILAVTTVTAVDATAKATVLAGGTGATQFVIDVLGYFG
jgi:hypothetical protein